MTIHINGEFTDGPYTYINYVMKVKVSDQKVCGCFMEIPERRGVR